MSVMLKYTPARITALPLEGNEYKIIIAASEVGRKWHRDLIRPSVCASLIPREVFILVEADVDSSVRVRII